jgi:hypothetical protein
VSTQEIHEMPDKFHFMTDKFHLMPDPTQKQEFLISTHVLLNERSFSIMWHTLDWLECVDDAD